MQKKILLVDDALLIRTFLTDELNDEFEVRSATSAEEAIGIIEKGAEASGRGIAPFDLIITDLSMPGLSGYDLAKYVRQMNREKKFTPVIMLTEMEITKDDARQHGCAAYIPKSELHKVKALVKRLLQVS
jgi:CheY-like chemotaxis protein